MILDSLLAGTLLFTSFAVRTPNVQPNPDDYEISVGIDHSHFHINRQWERELGHKYVDDLVWFKFENGIYWKPEYMNKESRGIKFLKMDWRNKWKDWTYGFTTRSIDEYLDTYETFFSFGIIKKKKYGENIEIEYTTDVYFPPDEDGENTTLEFEDKFKLSYNLTKNIRLYNLGEVSKLKGREFYKAKIGVEISL